MTLHRIRRRQWLRQAEGYLELGMPQHALDALARYGDLSTMPGEACFWQGEALRALGRHEEALVALARAAEKLPSRAVEIGLAMGWCHKRTGRVDLAIADLESAAATDPENALILYNLACYWSLVGNKRQTLLFLSQALSLDPSFREQIADESDFDNVRSDPAFIALATVSI